MPGIFVDPNATFPIRVYYKSRFDDDGNEIGVELWNPAEPPEEPGWSVMTGFFRQVDEDSFGTILEEATIINHVNHRPTLMTKVLRQRVLDIYMVGWDVGEDGEGGHEEDDRIQIVPRWYRGSKFKIANRMFVEFMGAADLADVVRIAADNDAKYSKSPGFLDPALVGNPMQQVAPDQVRQRPPGMPQIVPLPILPPQMMPPQGQVPTMRPGMPQMPPWPTELNEVDPGRPTTQQ